MIAQEIIEIPSQITPQRVKMWILYIILGIVAAGFLVWAIRAWLARGWKERERKPAPYRPGSIEWHRPGDKADKAPPSGEQEAGPK